ncbi:hypothetical protein J6590_049109 [Homalodisca vitripennis]|nr:hypothetical protein J6590_049109 [Homalodisca vitripennis]
MSQKQYSSLAEKGVQNSEITIAITKSGVLTLEEAPTDLDCLINMETRHTQAMNERDRDPVPLSALLLPLCHSIPIYIVSRGEFLLLQDVPQRYKNELPRPLVFVGAMGRNSVTTTNPISFDDHEPSSEQSPILWSNIWR